MPSLRDLLNNLPTFNYYSGGPGNFTQKSIPFGNDRPGGGSSGQPYVVRGIDQRWSPDNIDDGTIRDGIIGATNRTISDVQRISRFFADVPKGPLFIAKQVGLQLSNPKLESLVGRTSPTPTGNVFNDALTLPSRIQNDIGTTRTYNLGINTLAQVEGVAFGTHFYRHGLGPDMAETDKYISVVAANNQDKSNSSVSVTSANRLVRFTANLQNSSNLIVDSYSGGPQSVYGVGTTTINRTIDTIGDKSVTQQSIDSFTPIRLSDLSKIGRDGVMIISRNASGQNSFDTKTQDFRELKNDLYNAGLPSTDYATLNMGTRIRRGNPGVGGQDRSNYANSLLGTQDLINKLSLFYASAPPGTDSNITDLNSGEVVDAPAVRDLVKFRIEAIDNDNPTYSVWMVFRAFISAFDEGYTAELDSYKYTGRGETFYVYNGAVRQITLSFKIAAQSRDEMKPLYQKLNYLISNMYPDYNSANKMRAPLTKLTLGDYIYRQPGFIQDLHVGIPMDAPWEIALNEPEGGLDANMHEVPMILEVSMNFIPIHDFLPRKGASTPFISVNGRKSPSDPLSPPTPNNWLADNGSTNNTDGSKKYVSLSNKISSARNAVLQ